MALFAGNWGRGTERSRCADAARGGDEAKRLTFAFDDHVRS